MSLKSTIISLSEVADALDQLGMIHEANVITSVMMRTAQYDPNVSEWHNGEDEDVRGAGGRYHDGEGVQYDNPEAQEYWESLGGFDGPDTDKDLDEFKTYLSGLVKDINHKDKSQLPIGM